MNYKTVKIPEWAYENAVAARNDLMHRGLDALPRELLEPPACPRCGGSVEYLNVSYQHLSCGDCGYRQGTVMASGNSLGGLGLGVLLGLGVAALLGALDQGDEATPRRRRGRR